MPGTMSMMEAAVAVLREAGQPLHYKEICQRFMAKGLVSTSGKTPEASLAALLSVESRRSGPDFKFVKTQPGTWGLKEWTAGGQAAAPAAELSDDRRVRTPYFPLYSEVRLILPLWVGTPRRSITGLRNAISQLRGTPQEPVDWSDPAEWIPERLPEEHRSLAEKIWKGTNGKVNPRHVQGHWLLACRYGLVAESGGNMGLTDRGREFNEGPGRPVEAEIDEQEGLLKLLAIVSAKGQVKFGGMIPDWSEYLQKTSNFGTDSTTRDTLHRRLANLVDRGLLTRSGTMYSLSDAGLQWLNDHGEGDMPDTGAEQQIRALALQQQQSVREALHELLIGMDPYAFEHLVRRLLEAMDYQDVQVTSRSNDKGVDVVGDIELGISSVREVVQVKRHSRTIQRKDLDALRGCLHRFGAVRGTIITTAGFSRGTTEAAFERGAAPITLIHGDKLLDLLIEHGIGVRKKSPVEILEIDPSGLSEPEGGENGASSPEEDSEVENAS